MFAIPKELWKAVLTSSIVNVCGSPATAVHVMFPVPPEVKPVGVSMERAETKGAATARGRLRGMDELSRQTPSLNHQKTYASLAKNIATEFCWLF